MIHQSERLDQLHLLPIRGGQVTTDFKKWIADRHYLESTPPGAIVKLWVLLKEERIGALMWGRPTSRYWAELPILELTRAVFEDATPPNVESRSLSLARKYIRTYMPHIRLVLAYSSLGEGHQGGIYEADGWCPLGKTVGQKWGRWSRPRETKDVSDKLRWVRTP